jgi:hypothetical protein
LALLRWAKSSTSSGGTGAVEKDGQ